MGTKKKIVIKPVQEELETIYPDASAGADWIKAVTKKRLKKEDKKGEFMKALTIKQPWANEILYCGKDIENRSINWKHRGLTVLHAGAKISSDAYTPGGYKDHVVLGAIIGVVEIIDCVEEHDSPHFDGPFGYVLANPRPLLKPIPYAGQVGLWNVSPEAEKEIKKQLKLK